MDNQTDSLLFSRHFCSLDTQLFRVLESRVSLSGVESGGEVWELTKKIITLMYFKFH